MVPGAMCGWEPLRTSVPGVVAVSRCRRGEHQTQVCVCFTSGRSSTASTSPARRLGLEAPGLRAQRRSGGSARSFGGDLGGGDCVLNVADLDVPVQFLPGHADHPPHPDDARHPPGSRPTPNRWSPCSPPNSRPRGQNKYSIEGAVRLAALPCAGRAADFRGLNQAQPSGEQQGRQPSQRNSQAHAADDDQPSRHDRGQGPRDLTNSNHE